MNIFPFIDGEVNTTSQQTELPTPKEYKWDFVAGDFVLNNGKFIVVEGLEAIEIWIYKALSTQRYRYLAYSWDYGSEIEDLIGSGATIEFITSEAQRYIVEALSVNQYIHGIKDVVVEVTDGACSISFTAITDYGEVDINV